MKLKIEIEIGNAACSTADDVAGIVLDAGLWIRDEAPTTDGAYDGAIKTFRHALRDRNGNLVGEMRVLDETA